MAVESELKRKILDMLEADREFNEGMLRLP